MNSIIPKSPEFREALKRIRFYHPRIHPLLVKFLLQRFTVSEILRSDIDCQGVRIVIMVEDEIASGTKFTTYCLKFPKYLEFYAFYSSKEPLRKAL